MNWQSIAGVVTAGHQVASGLGDNTPYPESTIKMQKPFFRELGLDLDGFYEGTLNISIAPHVFELVNPQYTFALVEWTDKHPPETFSFSGCQLIFEGEKYASFIYYPHPETKKRHFQNNSIIEVLAPLISDIEYNSEVILEYKLPELIIK